MPSESSLSQTSRRTTDSPISDLMQRALANPELVSLAAGFVDPASLPVEAVAKASAALLADPIEARRALQYGTTIGDPQLRRGLVRRLEREEAVAPGTFDGLESRVVVTTGSQQLLQLVTDVLIDPGDVVLVESPTYFVYMGVLESAGATVIGVETDEGGLCLDSLAATFEQLDREGMLPRVKLLYTVSEHSNPSGLSLAADRRGPLVELVRSWSKHRPIYILEDAAYRGLGFGGSEPPSVWSRDEASDRVILARTFSKTFSPGLKVGWGVVPEPLLAPILNLKGNHDFGTSNFAQVLLDRVLRDGTYDRQIETLRAIYREKGRVLDAALNEAFGDSDGVTWTHPVGGLYIWLGLPEGLDTGTDGPLFARCLKRGVLYVPGALAFSTRPGPVPTCFARLCFGVPTASELVEGVERLAAALSDCLEPVG